MTTGELIVITERGTPVLRLVPYRKDLQALRGTVVKYQSPTEPAGEDWDIAR